MVSGLGQMRCYAVVTVYKETQNETKFKVTVV